MPNQTDRQDMSAHVACVDDMYVSPDAGMIPGR